MPHIKHVIRKNLIHGVFLIQVYGLSWLVIVAVMIILKVWTEALKI